MQKQQSFWKPGSVVKLKEAWKPSLLDRNDYPNFTDKEFKAWKGFTLGIIVQIVSHDHNGKVRNVSLHLYDPETRLMYIEDANGIPVYIDYSTDELIPYKDGEVVGYEIIKS